MAVDLGPLQWQLKATFNYSGPTGGALRSGALPTFSKRLIQVRARVHWPETPFEGERWRRSGWLYQMAGSTLEVTARETLVNQPHLLSFPLLSVPYRLEFLPVRWLPNLNLEIWEYLGDEVGLVDELALLGGGGVI